MKGDEVMEVSMVDILGYARKFQKYCGASVSATKRQKNIPLRDKSLALCNNQKRQERAQEV